MAKQRFLQGTFTGSLGNVTGQTIHGKNIIKVKKWAKCHNGEKSNNACKAFTALHRVCTKVAPALATTVLEKTKTIDRIPTLEKMWKNWISENSFPVDGILKVASAYAPATIENMSFNEFTTTINFDMQNTAILPLDKEGTFFFFIHNEVGQVFATHFYPYKNAQITMQLPGTVEHQLYLSGGVLILYQGKWTFTSPFAKTVYIWNP